MLSFYSKVRYVPQSYKPNPLGEDAWFITPIVMGIADGVGGWALTMGPEGKPVDSGIYSRKLMKLSEDFVMQTNSRDPLEILVHAHSNMSDIKGTTTACILSLFRDELNTILRAINLGDSGFIHLRFDDSWYSMSRSLDQQHYFNCPLQLGTDSPDMPTHGDKYEAEVQVGDVILACN